jgi:hypothetical protein
MADETCRHLKKVGILPGKEKRCKGLVRNPAILLELSAVLRLSAWQESGLLDYVREEETSALYAAMQDSVTGLTQDPSAFAQEEGLPPLSEKVFAFWEKYLAWTSLEQLGADMFLEQSPSDEDEMLKELADWLWTHRHLGQL